MKRRSFSFFLAFIMSILTGCQLQDSYSGRVVLSGFHSIQETINGELVVTGGEVHLQPGSVVTSSVHIFAGTVQIDGDVAGDVMILAGRLSLGPEATIHGDLNGIGGELVRSDTAQILGKISLPAAGSTEPAPPGNQAGRLLTIALELPLLIGLAYLSARFLPGNLANIGHAGRRYVIPSAALGLLGWVVGLSLLLLMAYTILLIPLTILGFFAMIAATSFGAVPYAIWLGRWISQRLKWSLPVDKQSALGMAGLVLLVELLRFVPFVGAALPLVLFIASFGAVLLTRFGLHRFVPPVLNREFDTMD